MIDRRLPTQWFTIYGLVIVFMLPEEGMEGVGGHTWAKVTHVSAHFPLAKTQSHGCV